MKSLVVILFTLFYFFASAGVSFNLHYCGGNLKSLSLFSKSQKSCCGNTIKSKGCCHNSFFSLKVKEKQEPTHLLKINLKKATEKLTVITFSNDYVPFIIDNRSLFVNHYSSPPILYKTPLFLMNRVLII